MRGFFILLILSNILFFSWVLYIGERDEPAIPSVDMPGNRLVVLSEIPTDERPPLRQGQVERAAPSTPARILEESPLAGIPSMRCVTVTNIANTADRDSLLIRLRELSASQIEIGEEGGTRSNYWVLLPAFRSRGEADAMANRLTGLQVRDFFVVRSGEHENAISLGVFSSMERAQSRQTQINTLKLSGVKPEIEIMQLPTRSHWLRYRIGAEKSPPVAVLRAVGEVQETDCP
ncbi:MAG: SPOR domain-containing protein [Chromatiales bacterium]|nr:SPOR domain-containing protein [Gammaproteobacteria bacterium]MBW6475789.1 SPOR domain-containing protein [Chromatiales bacterium]